MLNRKYSLLTFVLTFISILSALFAVNFAPYQKTNQNSNISKIVETTSKVNEGAKTKITESYGKLPLIFEQNQGQLNSDIKYIHRGSGQNLFFTQEGVIFSVSSKSNNKTQNIKMHLVESNKNAKVTAIDEQVTKTNYFMGNDASKWKTNISNFAKVKYESIYEGIDLLFYGNQSQLEYDLVLAPKVDPKQIQIAFDGAKSLSTNKNGDLIINTEVAELIQHKPIIYQVIDGEKRFIDGAFNIKDKTVGFDLASYDSSKELVIDPPVSLSYSTYLGGNSTDQGFSIAVDSTGNAYVSGATLSTNYPTTVGAFDTTQAGSNDVFVTKLNATGTALIYSTFIGNTGNDGSFALAIDTAGNAYVTGFTTSVNFPVTQGAFQTTLAGNQDSFITKLNSSGNGLLYSSYLGGSSLDQGLSLAVDSAGNAYISGLTSSTNFPTTTGAFQTTLGGGQDAFVSKINSGGTAILYSSYLGGVGNDQGLTIAIDSTGNAYVGGFTFSNNFPTTPGAFKTTLNASRNGFITKLNTTGTALVYSTYLGGTNQEQVRAIAVDSTGNAYVSGLSESINFPVTVGAFQSTFGGGPRDAFIAKLNSTGNALLYATYLGASAEDFSDAIAVDSTGNAYVSGFTSSTNFPITPGAFQPILGGSSDLFVTKLNSTGSSLMYSTYLGGSGSELGPNSFLGIAIDMSGNAYVVDTTSSTNFPTTSGAFQTTLSGGLDVSVSKLKSSNLDHTSVYVADTNNNRIQLSTDDGVSWKIVGLGTGSKLGQFNRPMSVSTNSTDMVIFVADTGNNRIQRSTDGGISWQLVASAGTAIGQVNQPQALAYDEASDKLYIADTANNRIQFVNSAATALVPFASIFANSTAGLTLGKFNQPKGIAVDSNGKVYVADTANNRIQVNTTGLASGWAIFSAATAGTALGKVNQPRGIYVDAMDRVYVADTANNRIQMNVSGNWSIFMNSGTFVGSVNSPQGVVFASSGNVFIGDTGNNRIQKKPVNGGTSIVVGLPGLSVGQFNQPSGVR